ncbi:hypothetical protein EYF80_035588 [Liparis tanakae]|uniref:Immunoglobulin domain-containing protein n=1 Tax=Liparis tanakae TaxID=230148 RepID=A0A4Z2GL69_9TELE|nr:hypothetical protein EYF80_035588 [Liparis tanakae]
MCLSSGVAGRLLSSTSPVLHSALVVPAGGNASLTCNLTLTSEVSWYRLHSDRLLPLLTVTPTKLGGLVIKFHSEDRRLSATGGAVVGDPVHLGLHQVAPQDAGLYFCTARCGRSVGVAAIRLVVDGLGEEADRPPCWSLGICVLPALLLLILVFIAGLCLHSGKQAVCCHPQSQRVTEEESLHYSSLRHAHKPRPPGRGGAGLVEDDVTYSAVMRRENLSRDLR